MSSLSHLKPVLENIVDANNVRSDELMSKHTTFKLGGPAALFVTPSSADELKALVKACREASCDYFVVGCGSDLLVADEGYEGVIISMTEELKNIDSSCAPMGKLCAQAGATLKELSQVAADCALSGLEFACGIPGSVGGACFMNAGAYDGCIADVLESVVVLSSEGELLELKRDELDLGYRHSRIADEGLIVLSATFTLEPGDASEIRAKMADLNERRKEKQPLEYPSAGSTFKRPEGYFAGKLISDAGLKGYRVQGAAVSTKHAGFVVNLGGATAADVRAVISHVQKEVERQFGVYLEPELRFLP